MSIKSTGGGTFSFSNIRRKSSSLFSSNLNLDGKPRRDSSPTRLKRAVTEFATKVKRVTTRHHFGHLDVPKIEFGSPAAKTNDVVAARGRRPSIAPVPAMLGEDSSSSGSGSSQSGSESDTQPEVSTPHVADNAPDTNEPSHTSVPSHTVKNGNAKTETTTTTACENKFIHQKDQWTFPAERSL